MRIPSTSVIEAAVYARVSSDAQAAIVRQVFEWIGRDRLSIGEVTRRLTNSDATTATGKQWWDRTTVWGMLKNPAYKDSAAFGKTRTGPRRPQLRTQRGHSKTPRRTGSTYDTEVSEQLSIPVPALVSSELFDGVLDRSEFDPRLQRARERLSKHEEQLHELESESREQSTLREALSCLDSFCASIGTNLEAADWTLRREILRTLIDKVWKQLVPIREKPYWRLTADWFGRCSVSAEVFHYAQGFALVVTAYIRGDDFALREAAQMADTMYRDGKYDVTWEDNTTDVARLREFASDALNRIRKTSFGENVPQGQRLSEPFSIATFVRVDDTDAENAIGENGDVHQTLEWLSSRRDDTHHDLETAAITYPSRKPSHVLYVLDRGRAVWFPSRFAMTKRNVLGCYHRNLMFASLQTDVLAGMTAIASDALDLNRETNRCMDILSRMAVHNLGELYLGESTYRSRSVEQQRDHHPYRDSIKRL